MTKRARNWTPATRPGRKALAPGLKRDITLPVRFNDLEYQAVCRNAMKAGLSLSAWARTKLL